MKITYNISILIPLIFSANLQASPLHVSLSECASVESDMKRLKCFDGLAKSEKSKEKTLVSTVQLHKKTDQNKKVDNFGAKHLDKHESKKAESIILTVSHVKKDPYKRLILTFKNGQVWKQTNDRYFKIKAGEQAVLAEGALGSIDLNKLGKSQKIKVKRIK